MSDHFLSPFGNPEGARAELAEVTRGFVEFEDPRRWKGLATQPDDFTARIFVGQKGSGKTLYLRRAHDYASQDKNYIAADIEDNVPLTSDIQRFSSLFSKYDLREHWSLMWQRAIMRSVASHILNSDQFTPYVDKDLKDRIKREYTSILRPVLPYRAPVGVYNEVRDILRHQTYHACHTYLNDPQWGQLETELHDVLRHAPPLCIYLDGIDDSFQHSPMHWLECQIGLFNCLTHLIRDSRFGGRLHIFTAVRDIVLLKLLQGEHAMRNYEEPHIRVLFWDYHAISHFLNEKVKTLNKIFFSLEGDRNLQSWLGMAKFNNRKRGVQEPIVQYLLRHTRLLPRDVVTLGNLLCQELHRTEWMPEYYTREAAISRAVSFASKISGAEQLKICAHQLATDIAKPKDQRRPPTYSGTDEYLKSLVDEIVEFIRQIGRDRLSKITLKKHDEIARQKWGDSSDLLNILWLNGLLGYAIRKDHQDSVTFYSTNPASEFKLPRDRNQYAFHSCLIDAVGLKAVGKPVVQSI